MKKTKSSPGMWRRHAGVALASLVLAGGLPLASHADTPGQPIATEHANENADDHGGNLGRGAAPAPEPATWAMMGTLAVAVAGLVIAQKRRQAHA